MNIRQSYTLNDTRRLIVSSDVYVCVGTHCLSERFIKELARDLI